MAKWKNQNKRYISGIDKQIKRKKREIGILRKARRKAIKNTRKANKRSQYWGM